MAKFLALVGINYPDGSGGEKRVEAGETVEDLPEKASKWLERDGYITKDLHALDKAEEE